MNMVYLDNAATTRMRDEVLQAMLPYLTEAYGNPSALYSLGQEASNAIAAARETAAASLRTNPKQVIFTSGGTESDNWAVKGVAHARRTKGRHIITSAIEHHAVLRSCQALEREGFEVTYLPVDENGLVSTADFAAAMRPDTVLASIMFANNEIGTVQPIAELAGIAHRNGAVFHTDAVQAFGHEAIDVDALGIDLLSASAHKLHGPKGVGLLYVRQGTDLERFIDGGSQERGRRAGTENVAGIVGFAKAIELAQAELRSEHKRQASLRDRAIDRILTEIPGSKLNGHPTKRLANNINVSFHLVNSESLLLQLSFQGMCASGGSACAAGSLDPSHVLTALGLTPEEALGSIRLTLGRFTTESDMDHAVDVLARTVSKLRSMNPQWNGATTGSPQRQEAATCASCGTAHGDARQPVPQPQRDII